VDNSQKAPAFPFPAEDETQAWSINAGLAREMIALHAKMDKVLAQLGTFMQAMAHPAEDSAPVTERERSPRERSPQRSAAQPCNGVHPPSRPPPGMIPEPMPASEASSPTHGEGDQEHAAQVVGTMEPGKLVEAADECNGTQILQFAPSAVQAVNDASSSPRHTLLTSRSRHSSSSEHRGFFEEYSTPIVPLKRAETQDSNCSKASRQSRSGAASSFLASHRSSKSSLSKSWHDKASISSLKSGTSRRSIRRHAVIIDPATGQETANTNLKTSASAAVVQHVRNKQRKRSNVELKVWRFLEDPRRNPRAHCFAWCMDLVTMCAVVSALFDNLLWADAGWEDTTSTALQFLFDGMFVVEILLRFAVCPNRCRFFREVYNVIDIVAGLVPLTMRVLAVATDTDLLHDSLVCVVPCLRMLKLLRHFEQFHLLTQAFAMAFEALPFLLYTLTLIIFAFSSWVFLVEPRQNVPDFGTALWLSLLTASTVGYGDIVPETPTGKIAISILVVLAGIYTSIPFGIVGGAFNQVWTDRDRLLLMHRTRLRLLEVGIAPEEFPALFRLFDSDGDGELSIDEFEDLLRQLRVNMSRRRLVELFRLFDIDESGTIDGDEFVRVLFPSTMVQQRDKTWSEDVATAAAAGAAFRNQKTGGMAS